MPTPKCPTGYGGRGKPLTNEIEFSKELGVEPIINYFVESGLRAIVGSGRSPYWICTNPECRYGYRGNEKHWFKMDINMRVVPKSFTCRELHIYPKKPKRGR